jgi:hypothetical protein
MTLLNMRRRRIHEEEEDTCVPISIMTLLNRLTASLLLGAACTGLGLEGEICRDYGVS